MGFGDGLCVEEEGWWIAEVLSDPFGVLFLGMRRMGKWVFFSFDKDCST